MLLRHRVVMGVGRPGLDPDGNRIRVTHPDGVYFSYSYDGLDRMTGISEAGTTPVASVTYDAQGRRSGATRAGVSTAYSYDRISRLASLTNNLSGTTNDVRTNFAWNPASQMIRKVRDNDGYGFTASVNVDRDYGVNGLNQYVSAGPAAFSYDANGNLTGDGATTYAYDVENRLVTASGASAVTMVWDPKGRLYQTGGGGFGATQYLYDGDELLVEYTTTGTIRRRYVHGPGDDDPMLWYEGATLTDQRSLQTDHQGSVVSIADASGALVAINAYDEYGIPQNSLTGATEPQGRFAYTGQAWIPELGMYHYKARVYSPTLGRFLQTDPIGYEDQFNLYAYVGSDPVNGRDPSGLYDCAAGTSPEDCSQIGKYASGVAESRDSYEKGSVEYQRLDETALKLGTAGDGNGITISNGVTTSGGTAEANGNAITIDLKLVATHIANSLGMDYIAPGVASDRYERIYGAGILGHEIDHSINSPFEQSWQGITEIETSAYTTQEYIWRTDHVRAFDDKAWGVGSTWIKNNVPISVLNWCRRSGKC